MADFDFDLVVIGGGSGGVRAARIAAELGARTALVEAGKLGGTCINAGCVPKKLLVYGAEFARAFTDAGGYGFAVPPRQFDWAELIAHKDREVARLNAAYARTLELAGVDIVHGRARFLDPHSLAVGERRKPRARHVLIATGGAPYVPDFPGRALAITSDDAFHLPRVPERVTVVGAGYIGVEFASIFNALGARVQLVLRASQVLSGFDQDVGDYLGRMLAKSGIELHRGVEACAIERSASGLRVALTDGSALETDLAMFATGRRPRTAELGLGEIGVHVRAPDGAIAVDNYGRSSVPHVFAVGDAPAASRSRRSRLRKVRRWRARCWRRAATCVEYEQHADRGVFAAAGRERRARRSTSRACATRSSTSTARVSAAQNTISGRDEQSSSSRRRFT